jgi:hypothetical protein
MDQPRFVHDCDQCKFLGTHDDNEVTYDLYYCGQGGFPTVIARFGHEGPEYLSGLHSCSPPLQEAKSRAKDNGLSTEWPWEAHSDTESDQQQ